MDLIEEFNRLKIELPFYRHQPEKFQRTLTQLVLCVDSDTQMIDLFETLYCFCSESVWFDYYHMHVVNKIGATYADHLFRMCAFKCIIEKNIDTLITIRLTNLNVDDAFSLFFDDHFFRFLDIDFSNAESLSIKRRRFLRRRSIVLSKTEWK